MTVSGFPVFDAGGAVFEPSDLWERYLEPEYRVPARSAFYHHIDPSGLVTVIINGKTGTPMNQGKLIRQAIWRPGMTPEQIGELDPTAFYPLNPGASEPKARLADMDAMGVDRSLLLPTLFAEYLPVVENPDIAYALTRAYNDWVLDFSKAAPDRLFPAAVLPLQDVAFAVAEARRVAGRGFKAVAMRPIIMNPEASSEKTSLPLHDRFMTHPYYYPLMELLQELGVAACIHPSPGSTSPEWTSTGHFVERVAGNMNIGHNVAEAAAPVMDNTMAFIAFITSGNMEEYPNLKLAFAHSGATWVPLVLEKAETYLVSTRAPSNSSIWSQRRPSRTGPAWWASTRGRAPSLLCTTSSRRSARGSPATPVMTPPNRRKPSRPFRTRASPATS